MSHRPDSWVVENTHNTARFFTEHRHVSWVALAATVAWGIFGYFKMPQRKDPDVPVKMALAICYWPGVEATKVEDLVTRRLEEAVAENVKVETIESTTRTGMSFVYITLQESVDEPGKEFDDIKFKLDAIRDLPDGTSPIHFVKDFGTTAALMLTVASPKLDEVQLSIRARAVEQGIRDARSRATPGTGPRLSLVYCLPPALEPRFVHAPFEHFKELALEQGILHDARLFDGPGFIGLDCATDRDDAAFRAAVDAFIEKHLVESEFHPDGWGGAIIRDPADTNARLAELAPDKYTYRELEDYTELIKRTFQTIPQVSKVDRAGILEERVFLTYSQERLASLGVRLSALQDMLAARNVPISGGTVSVAGKTLSIDPAGEFRNVREIGDVIVGSSPNGAPLYLRDVVGIERGYDTPATYLNYFPHRDRSGKWQRTRSITLAVQMRSGEKIGEFGKEVDAALARLKTRLPEDLIYARTSDQPLQVRENIDLFMSSLLEAIVLVVVIALVGFWEWRSALLLALSIPLTLAMTFVMMSILGMDLQQISIASLIIALGLLVDDPVVAGDAIKRSLGAGWKPVVAAWLGPTKLATAILYATVTNIVAYLPFLLLPGDMGRFLYSLPVVLTCSLVASRLVSMTFVPLLGYYLLRPKRGEIPIHERRNRGFAGLYYRIGRAAIRRRWAVAGGSLVFLLLGGVIMSQLKAQFLPKDLSYLAYADIWLPEDAPISATREMAEHVEEGIRTASERYTHEHSHHPDMPLLESLTAFVGGGGPRFWFSVAPEPRQQNYAQIIIQTRDKHETQHLVDYLQREVAPLVAGARVNFLQLETGAAVGTPVSIRVSGDDMATLRAEGRKVAEIFRSIPTAERVKDDWGVEAFAVHLAIDPDRAAMARVTNMDAALSTRQALNGSRVGVLREGDKQIPIVTRLRMEERAQLSDLQNLYVESSQGSHKVPLRQISNLEYSMQPEKIQRRQQFRALTVGCYPVEGVLPSEVLSAAMPQLRAFERQLPLGFKMEIAGEGEEQTENFGNLAVVMAISIGMIFMALVLQFKNAVKPLLVFGAIPYGMVGAVAALWLMGMPFGFMGFLGVASLVGVIVSHVIVLFDFIEEAHERGEPLIEALLDAGVVRLRPVLITVGATVFALIPLAMHGGPLWEPMCYAQIGGLTAATVITLLLVPVLYSIFVLDLKIVRWEAVHTGTDTADSAAPQLPGVEGH